MSKGLSCFLCWLPLVLYIVAVIPMCVVAVGSEMGMFADEMVLAVAILMLLVAILFVVATYGVMIWLIVKTVKNSQMEGAIKVVWCICLYFLNVLAFPAYWFIYIRKEA